MSGYVGVAPLTIVDTRTESGAVMGVYVYAGRPVPENADPKDVKRLVREGFLAKAKAKPQAVESSGPRHAESSELSTPDYSGDEGQGQDGN